MKKYRCGYTQGVFDMFHIGHLNLINNSKKYCTKLIVGVNSDQLVSEYKNKIPVINENDRKTIIENIKAVDSAIIVNTLNKIEILQQINFDVIFVGSDWKDTSRWKKTKEDLSKIGVDVVFLPYTTNISSTILREVENNSIKE